MTDVIPLVSVYCLAYNHEKYIRDCLEGFVSQKTSFPFEVVVHDDASTDKTADIIREYELKYPKIIKPIYEKENQFQKGRNVIDEVIYPLIHAKYVAICEGDDYWVDDNKLEEQISILERNPDCHFCVAGVEEVAQDKTRLGVFHPARRMESSFISPESFVSFAESYEFQTSSYVMRYDDWKEYILNPPEFRKKSIIGDLPMLLYFGSLGRTAYVDKVMSCYRRGAPASYSALRIHWSEKQRLAHWKRSMDTWKEFNQFSNGRFIETCSKAIARPMFDYCIVTCNAKSFLKRENAVFFRALPKNKKAYVLIATVFKRPIRALYRSKVKKHEEGILKKWTDFRSC